MSFVPKQLTIPAMPPVKKLEHKEKKMNRQRKVVITVTYNDLGTIVDTKAEELDSSAQPEIIRCKDCRHGVDYYHEGDCYCSNPKWGLMYFGGSWEFYCADAERRTDG